MFALNDQISRKNDMYEEKKTLRNQISSLSTEMAAAVGVRDETHMNATNNCD
jgi:hypothetical protein